MQSRNIIKAVIVCTLLAMAALVGVGIINAVNCWGHKNPKNDGNLVTVGENCNVRDINVNVWPTPVVVTPAEPIKWIHPPKPATCSPSAATPVVPQAQPAPSQLTTSYVTPERVYDDVQPVVVRGGGLINVDVGVGGYGGGYYQPYYAPPIPIIVGGGHDRDYYSCRPLPHNVDTRYNHNWANPPWCQGGNGNHASTYWGNANCGPQGGGNRGQGGGGGGNNHGNQGGGGGGGNHGGGGGHGR